MPISPENKKRYPKDWALRSRFIRVYRSGGFCEWCGVPNGGLVARIGENEWVCAYTGVVYEGTKDGCWPVREMSVQRVLSMPVAKIVLTAAHVYDHRPEKASLLNLAALCQRCHLRHDAPRKARQRLLRHYKTQELTEEPVGK